MASSPAGDGARPVCAEPRERARSLRPVIDLATGMLMAQHGCTADEAVAMLTAASRRTNRDVIDIAESMIDAAASRPAQPYLPPSGEQGCLIEALIAEALARDRRAEQRDRRAEARDLAAGRRTPGSPEDATGAVSDREQAAIDRVQAGLDRDASAADRADLRAWQRSRTAAARRASLHGGAAREPHGR